MQLNELYGGNYLAAADLQGRSLRTVIERVEVVTMQGNNNQQQTKAVLELRGCTKGLVLNKTNAAMIAASFTWNSDTWISREIELYPEKVAFQGRIVDSIRVRIPAPPAAVAPVGHAVSPAPIPTAAPAPPTPIAAILAMPSDIPYKQ